MRAACEQLSPNAALLQANYIPRRERGATRTPKLCEAAEQRSASIALSIWCVDTAFSTAGSTAHGLAPLLLLCALSSRLYRNNLGNCLSNPLTGGGGGGIIQSG